MIFLTYWFYVFAAVALPAYWLIPNKTARLIWLLITCVVFHTHFAGPAGVIPIIVLAVLTYLIGLSRQRWLCVIGIAVCVLSLLFYKYAEFLSLHVIGLASESAGQSALEFSKRWQPAAAPLAISFFAFEFIHYLYDIRRGSPSLKNPLHFANFALFWPTIVAGPIKRYEQFVPAMLEGAGSMHVEVDSMAYGLFRVTIGLIKKFAADGLTACLLHYTHDVSQFAANTLPQRWMLLGMLGLRILWDFSGYSDMAIGFARMLNIRVPENFNWPYMATSLTEFWHRWHISLSTWVRDYVYIPLGGSRHGLIRKTLNGLIAFALVGLWHGAAWNFIAWGVYHGIGLAIVSSYAAVLGPIGRILQRTLAWLRPLTWTMTLLFVSFGWLLFFYPLPDAWRMFTLLFVNHA